MPDIDRRDVFTMFSALAVLTARDVFAQQSTPQRQLTTAELSRSRVVRFKDLPVVALDNGGEQRRVMSGTLPTGEFIEIHETVLPAGKVPHAPHKHPNSEWLFIQERWSTTTTGRSFRSVRGHRVQRLECHARPAQHRRDQRELYRVFGEQTGGIGLSARVGESEGQRAAGATLGYLYNARTSERQTMGLSAGTRLAAYEIVSALGAGASGRTS